MTSVFLWLLYCRFFDYCFQLKESHKELLFGMLKLNIVNSIAIKAACILTDNGSDVKHSFMVSSGKSCVLFCLYFCFLLYFCPTRCLNMYTVRTVVFTVLFFCFIQIIFFTDKGYCCSAMDCVSKLNSLCCVSWKFRDTI